jgi:hypothetical protein
MIVLLTIVLILIIILITQSDGGSSSGPSTSLSLPGDGYGGTDGYGGDGTDSYKDCGVNLYGPPGSCVDLGMSTKQFLVPNFWTHFGQPKPTHPRITGADIYGYPTKNLIKYN